MLPLFCAPTFFLCSVCQKAERLPFWPIRSSVHLGWCCFFSHSSTSYSLQTLCQACQRSRSGPLSSTKEEVYKWQFTATVSLWYFRLFLMGITLFVSDIFSHRVTTDVGICPYGWVCGCRPIYLFSVLCIAQVFWIVQGKWVLWSVVSLEDFTLPFIGMRHHVICVASMKTLFIFEDLMTAARVASFNI